MPSGLSPQESAYYARHLTLPEVGHAGQEKLTRSSVLLIGLGGLGSPLSLYLAAAGIGRIGIFEFDRIESSNLHRQILYGSSQTGASKIETGVARLRDLNPHIRVDPYPVPISAANARETIRQYDVVADGADNFPTRFLVNDACVLEGKPLVSASILRFEGQLSVFNYRAGPCYRCLYPEPPPAGTVPSCAEGGVLGVLPGVMGTLQAMETIKVILGLGEIARGQLLCYDALAATIRKLRFERAPDCPVCGERPSIRELQEVAYACDAGAPEIAGITARDLRARLAQSPGCCLVLDVRENDERAAAAIEPSLHLPLPELLKGAVELPKDQTLVVHCHSGARSLQAARYLADRGHTNVVNLTGGIEAWLALPDLPPCGGRRPGP